MKFKRNFLKFSGLLLILIFLCSGKTLFANKSPHSIIEQLKEIDANVIFMRHALAPGFGDPENFNLDSCETQRNLNVDGRQQAIDSGHYLRNESLKFDAIYSSQWCRCLETAKLLNFSIEESFAGLNSFFQGHDPKKSKPITCLSCNFNNAVLKTQKMTQWASFDEFEKFLGSTDIWIAGIDFPFGQSRKFIKNIGWPKTWRGYVDYVSSMNRSEF